MSWSDKPAEASSVVVAVVLCDRVGDERSLLMSVCSFACLPSRILLLKHKVFFFFLFLFFFPIHAALSVSLKHKSYIGCDSAEIVSTLMSLTSTNVRLTLTQPVQQSLPSVLYRPTDRR